MLIVIPCWNFGDLLAQTLSAWVELATPERVLVVTHPDDAETQGVARDLHVGVSSTRVWENDRALVNKAEALNAGFSNAKPGELCFSIDADSYPEGRLPTEDEIEPDTIYGCLRVSNQQARPIERVANLPYIKKHGRGDAPESCGGYFQAFRYDPSRDFGSFRTAAGPDYHFAFSFPHGAFLDCIQIIHLGERRVHWKGRQR